MKYLMSKEDRDRLVNLIDRSPLECSQTERTVCLTILERLEEIPEEPIVIPVRPDGGILCSDGWVRYPDKPSVLGYD